MNRLVNIGLIALCLEGYLCDVMNKRCMMKYDLSHCYSISENNKRISKCPDVDLCRKTYKISYMNRPPYNFILLDFLLRTCCGDCVNYTEHNSFQYISQLTESNINTSHFVFPVMGRSDAVRLHGHYFIPVVEPPILYYISSKDDSAMLHLLSSCLHMWPLIVICLLLAAVAGFICWVIETWKNSEEFPRSFILGWLEGFWWSFTTMSTVGYGDKIPRSATARIFCVFWILIGITAFSIITATLSSELTKANYPQPQNMARSRVGARRDHMYDATVISTQGGAVVEIGETGNSTLAVYRLIRLLRDGEIDGFVLDRYTYFMFTRTWDTMNRQPDHHDDDENGDDDMSFLMSNTIRTEKKYEGGKLSLGVLVKNRDDYEYFVDFVADNKLVLKACGALYVNNLTYRAKVTVNEDALFSMFHGLFAPTITTVMIAITAILCFGLSYEYVRRKYSKGVELSYSSDKAIQW